MTMQDNENAATAAFGRTAWNKGKLVGAKPPLRPKHVWSIRTKLQIADRKRDLAMFNLAIEWTGRGLVLALALATISTSSFALGTAEQRAACTPDAFRLCSSEIPNVERVIVCLRQNKPHLSKPCQAVMDSPISNAAARTR
jgi:hypothetical protein